MASGSVTGEKMISLEKVLDILNLYGVLTGYSQKEKRKPTHGGCCTCQECGRDYDNCVCEHNDVLASLLEL